ncbi:MAG: hypothetical protein IH955_01155 [Chloroflexi bacterium]|nr:hypothetical protein [Chloroflexota bacterium]
MLQNNTAPAATYFFRMVKAGGAPLDSYVRFPQITTPPPLILTQEDYRWHGNDDDLEPGQAIAPENSAIAIFSTGLVLRLRMNIEVEGVDLSQGAQAFKLQFATSTSGPWTDVGAIGSGAAWAGFDNPDPDDGDEIDGDLLSTTDVRESYEEENPSAINPGSIEVGELGEWDWVVFDNDTELDTIYFFRMVKADGTPLDSYTRFPQITVPAALDITQQDYRWYGNLANADPVIVLAPENTELAGATPLSVFRIRMNLTIDGRAMPAGSQAFKLQYATSTSGPWTDVGAIGSGETWRGFNNGGVADGADITALRLAASDVLETYEERNPSAPNTNTVNPGQQAEWDWVVQNNVASPGTYFFRMVTSDGSPLDEYTNYPEINAVMPPLTQQDYRWYQNENDVNPNSPLAGENAGFATAAPGAIYRIRMNVEVTGVALPLGALAFKLQYSTDTSGPWTDVGNINSSGLWRGFNNSSPTDEDPISLRLASSDVGESYEEANPSRVNRNAIAVGSRGEWDWVVQNNGALGDTTYFFRMVQADSTPLNAYTNFPTLSTILPAIASDDFESGGASGGSGWLGPWNFDGDAKVEQKDEPHQGSFHLRLKRTNGHADRDLDLFGKNSVRVQFWAKADKFSSGDTATLSASTDGITYEIVETWTISDSDGEYHFFDIELPASSYSSTSFIAFDSNMSDKKAKFFIDELIVIGD